MNKKLKRLSRYFALTRAGIMKSLSFRSSHIIVFVGNIVYMIIVYFLWKSIFESSALPIVNGMTFRDTVVYLVLANALYHLLDANLVWDMGEDIQSGAITVDLVKPLSYPIYAFFKHSGNYLVSLFFTFLPTFILCKVILPDSILLGYNLIFFVISLFVGLLINFCIDFFVGTVCIYTQSIWGINIVKEVVVLLLSGATIPLQFFPDKVKRIVDFLPFQAIYNTTMQLLLNDSMSIYYIYILLLKQCMWLVLMAGICAAFWKKAIYKIALNGG